MNCHEKLDSLEASVVEVDCTKLTDGNAESERCKLVVEQFITLSVDEVGNYSLMCTPCDLRALAVGFLFSEGLITRLEVISMLAHCETDPATIRVRLTIPSKSASGRNLIVSSSCGMCGSRGIDDILAGITPVKNTLRMPKEMLIGITSRMQEHQHLFKQTGGTHGAGIINPEGQILQFAEDIGRHNALDKAIGKCLLHGQPTQGCGALLSGRVSVDMVIKAARAGIELIAAVSAPSSLAVEAAERCNITLCGFVRADRATVYSCAVRTILDDHSV